MGDFFRNFMTFTKYLNFKNLFVLSHILSDRINNNRERRIEIFIQVQYILEDVTNIEIVPFFCLNPPNRECSERLDQCNEWKDFRRNNNTCCPMGKWKSWHCPTWRYPVEFSFLDWQQGVFAEEQQPDQIYCLGWR